MRVEFDVVPASEGIFGPEILLNAVSGVGCLRFEDGKVIGRRPEVPVTNAFVVWLGRPIVVVSGGVEPENVPRVAKELRLLLEDLTVPVVVCVPRDSAQSSARAISDIAVSYIDRELARAEAYVRVQAAWEEGDRIEIELDGRPYSFRLEFRAGGAGGLVPHVE
ncbi:hypothetical protein LVJ94_49020 [Pendulispora rubella]|uniref:Uncharacterized protein n=1 Tax=Pendulispora rubella TaxID=2741070 RepID=A0ABZ2L1K2_9BACT